MGKKNDVVVVYSLFYYCNFTIFVFNIHTDYANHSSFFFTFYYCANYFNYYFT